MARVKGVSNEDAGRVTRGVFAAAKKRLGQVPEPMRIVAHSGAVLWAVGGFELAIGRASRMPERLKNLAGIKAGALVGCVF